MVLNEHRARYITSVYIIMTLFFHDNTLVKCSNCYLAVVIEVYHWNVY